ncbi:uncharacterized protein FOMMEDRAFT_161886 [Fomitiporia mediterranea MF3/22]|uniref:uncharacterized protein n=1 Tax=Fomitiporia mediterranea (strain MF3/22) TaxID=694068 RepID=UPI0004407A28|nr:uncharacterized protein FOMMEDRAFT_161886 [Fomitiporia mediterranea MF3/22]EJC98510.1 hypothetical protein FOMMEDRAFT_161886 [Fomitiporia mediterranea MF3/22]
MATLDLGQAVSLASNVYIYRVTFVATLAALTYDYLLTIGHEKELVWPSRVSVVKILFLLNRYVPFVGISGSIYVLISLDTRKHLRNCIPGFWAGSAFIIAEYALAELILYTRAYAIWGRTRTALVMIIVVILLVFTPGVYFASTTLKSATLHDLPIFPTGCLISLDGHTEMLPMIFVVVSEAVALLAVLVKAG